MKDGDKAVKSNFSFTELGIALGLVAGAGVGLVVSFHVGIFPIGLALGAGLGMIIGFLIGERIDQPEGTNGSGPDDR